MTIRVDAGVLARSYEKTPEWMLVVQVILGSGVAFVSTLVWLIYWLVPSEDVLDVQVWIMGISIAIASWGWLGMLFHERMIVKSPSAEAATESFRQLNKDHQAMCRESLITLYGLDDNTSKGLAAQRERLQLINKVLAKQNADSLNSIVIDNSDIIAMREYVGMKGTVV